MASGQVHKRATPLVLPNNSTWNEQTGEYTWNQSVERKTLVVQQRALDQLKKIKGDVCVVSIAGPCRQGKSYILSKAFDQGQVFPLGHELDPETMGIWMWIIPKKFQDSNGREFTVILFDSEGIDATSSEGSNDHSIFTLSVLLSSIMIYNSAGRPSRSDLEGLDFIVKLSQRIQLYTNATEEDEKHFFEAFPYFIWLLRDVVLSLPKECDNIKEYFTKKVFKTDADGKPSKAAESILTYFSSFDAFSFPPPAYDPEANKNIDDEKSAINPQFRKKVEEFKTFLHPKLSPKRSINEGEFVTGEALAALAELFVKALNTPGAVPNVQNAWNTFVKDKCTELLGQVLQKYESEMKSQVENKLPCEADEIRAVHDELMESCFDKFKQETSSLSVKSMDEYLEKLTEKANPTLSDWLDKNRYRTDELCSQLIIKLKADILDPVLARLRSSEGCKMDFGDIVSAYNKIEQEYTSNARGAKEVQATVFLNFHPELQKEMEQNMDLLKQFKDYDESLAKEKAVSAQLEAERLKMKEENARKDEERRNKEREVALLREKQKEEMIRLQEMFEKNQRDQRETIKNMMEAQMEERRNERQEQLALQKTLEKKMEMMHLDMEKRENTFLELVQNMKEDKGTMQNMFDKNIRTANARQEFLEKTINNNIQDQNKERAAAVAFQGRLQETINRNIADQKQERAAAMELQGRLQEAINETNKDRRKERDAARAREESLKDDVRQKERDKEEMKHKNVMFRIPWR